MVDASACKSFVWGEPQEFLASNRFWKGIFGIRDLIKIRCGIREKAKYLGGKQDLTATREAGYTTICARDAGFFPSISGTGNHYADSNRRSSGKCDLTRRAFSCVSYQLSKLHMVIRLMIV